MANTGCNAGGFVDVAEREQMLKDFADGAIGFATLGGLSDGDLFAIGRVGAAAMQAGRFEQAIRVFVALSTLDPRQPKHAFHLALAQQGQGDLDGAAHTVRQQLRQAQHDGRDDDITARLYLLLAELLGGSDQAGALDALNAAVALKSPEAQKVVTAAVGVAASDVATQARLAESN